MLFMDARRANKMKQAQVRNIYTPVTGDFDTQNLKSGDFDPFLTQSG